MRNQQPAEYKIEKSEEIITKTIEANKPYYFSIEDHGSLIVTIYKPNECIGKRIFNNHTYRLLKCLVHEKNYEEVEFNMNHELQLSEKIAFSLLINKLKIEKLLDKDEVTLEIIKVNNYHYIFNIIETTIPRIQNTELRIKNLEYRIKNTEYRIQNIEYRRRCHQELTKMSPCLNQELTKIIGIREEFVKN